MFAMRNNRRQGVMILALCGLTIGLSRCGLSSTSKRNGALTAESNDATAQQPNQVSPEPAAAPTPNASPLGAAPQAQPPAPGPQPPSTTLPQGNQPSPPTPPSPSPAPTPGSNPNSPVSLLFITQQVQVSTECTTDADCALYKENLDQCGCGDYRVDLSLPAYQAANGSDVASDKTKLCAAAPPHACPLIAMEAINEGFTATCTNNVCSKVPQGSTGHAPCQNPSVATADKCGTNSTPGADTCVAKPACIGTIAIGQVPPAPTYFWGTMDDACKYATQLCE